MAGFRNKFIKMVSGISEFIPFSILSQTTRQNLILPVYHLVSDEEVPHIKNLYRYKNIRGFKQDLEFLLKHYQPIDLPELIEIVRQEKEMNRKKFLLTFDDGLRSFSEIIAPILIKKGVPAVNFLNSAFIDNKDLFYRYKVSIILDSLDQVSSDRQRTTLLSKVEQELKIPKRMFTDFISNLSYKQRSILDQIAHIFSIDFDGYLQSKSPYLTSVQIRKLIQDGFYFGAHSHDHPEYGQLTLAEQLSQTERSINEITSSFELPYKLFAFPFTDYLVTAEFFSRVNQNAMVDVSFGSAGMKQDAFSNHLQRIPMEMGNLPASKILHAEMLYYIFKMPFGKNRIIRI